MRSVRGNVDGLPEGFKFHDLRHFFASVLIASGLSVAMVARMMRHASPTTTLRTYGHLFPDADEQARAAITEIWTAARADYLRTAERG